MCRACEFSGLPRRRDVHRVVLGSLLSSPARRGACKALPSEETASCRVLLSPGASDNKVHSLALSSKVQRQRCELRGGAALDKEHLQKGACTKPAQEPCTGGW